MSFLESPFNPMATLGAQETLRSISSIDPKLSRTNYYDGRLLRASDLVRDQLYLDERLREVGRALGQGVVNGFDIRLTPRNQLVVTPGVAVTPSGRVLELASTTLEIDLLDSATLNNFNPGFRSMSAGLYAVMVQYAEEGTGSSEIYPKDLESQRGFHFNAYAEGVQFTLLRLPVNLPLAKLRNLSTEEIGIYSRSSLVRSFVVNNPAQLAGLNEDGVALGLLAVEYGEPKWLDKGLLRRPFRSAQSINFLQQDLYNHYEELLADVIELRRSMSSQQQFLARQYFNILPPVGTIPKDSVDPVNAYQNYFPDTYEVSISPVRADDVASIMQQSMALEPIDLINDKDVDIMIAVVIDDLNFSYLARKLQHSESQGETTDFVQPAHLDEILLSNFATTSDDSTTSALWQKLWAASKQVFYVRRPVRVAETQVSAVVLAKGKYLDLTANESLPVAAETLEEEIDALTQELKEAQTQITLLQGQLDTPDEEKLKAAQAAQAKAEADAETAKNQLQQAQDQLTQSQKDLSTAQDSVTNANAAAAKANDDAAAAKSNADATQTKLDAANSQIGDLQSQFNKAQDQIKKLQDQIKQLTDAGTNDQTITDLKTKLDELQKALDSAQQQVKDANATVDVNATQIKDLQTQLKAAQDEIEKLKAASNTINGEKILTPAEIEKVKVLKPAQLMPSTLNISDIDRKAIGAAIDADSTLLKPLSQLKAIVPVRYQDALWPTITAMIEAEKVQDFFDFVVSILQKGLPLGLAVAANTKLKLSTSLRNSWSSVDLA